MTDDDRHSEALNCTEDSWWPKGVCLNWAAVLDARALHGRHWGMAGCPANNSRPVSESLLRAYWEVLDGERL